ncbi:MAG: hypothetical protein ACLQMF_06620 [Rectinemataceae bacterium]
MDKSPKGVLDSVISKLALDCAEDSRCLEEFKKVFDKITLPLAIKKGKGQSKKQDT